MDILRRIILVAMALVVLLACSREHIEPIEEALPVPEVSPIAFNLLPVYETNQAQVSVATKAVKGGWENGDAIFVFFSTCSTPKYLKMTYDGSSWTSTEMNEANPGSLGLQNGDKGTLRAVYLPFGSSCTVRQPEAAAVEAKTENAGSYYFVTPLEYNKPYYTYYLTATASYTVSDNTVSGHLNMAVPDGYVQFYIADDSADTANNYRLATDAVIPTGVKGVSAQMANEEANLTPGYNMPGFAYGKGYLFSGKLNAGYTYSGKYYFALMRNTKRADIFFNGGKALSSHKSVLLPAYGSEGWMDVGPKDSVVIAGRTWVTCNVGATDPEELGTLAHYASFKADSLMTTLQIDSLVKNESVSWIPMSVYHVPGVVVYQADTKDFMFLPVNSSTGFLHYWGQSINASNACTLYLDPGSQTPVSLGTYNRTNTTYARYSRKNKVKN